MSIKSITIRQPDDFHLHLRQGSLLNLVLPYSAEKFGRALVMPNLTPPVTSTEQAIEYRNQIISQLPNESSFEPLMTLFLTENLNLDDLKIGLRETTISALKLYPAGATTNSSNGVKNFQRIEKILELLCEYQIPLCVHGEVSDQNVDIFDRESVFIDKILIPIRKKFPELKIVLEHITTKDAVDFIESEGPKTAATITVHHLFINRNHMFKDGIRPHYYCLPIAKRETHRLRLLEAVQSGNPKFFLGTDSAPHTKGSKENACGCAGVFSAPIAIEAITQLFDNLNILAKLENFISMNGAKFYNLKPNERYIQLSKQSDPQTLVSSICMDQYEVVLFDPEVSIYWKFDCIQNEQHTT